MPIYCSTCSRCMCHADHTGCDRDMRAIFAEVYKSAGVDISRMYWCNECEMPYQDECPFCKIREERRCKDCYSTLKGDETGNFCRHCQPGMYVVPDKTMDEKYEKYILAKTALLESMVDCKATIYLSTGFSNIGTLKYDKGVVSVIVDNSSKYSHWWWVSCYIEDITRFQIDQENFTIKLWVLQ